MKDTITLVNCIFRTEKVTFPINVYYLKYYLESFDYEVKILDYQLVKEDIYNPRSFIQFLKQGTSIICLSILSNFLPFLLSVFENEIGFFNDKTVILGGIGVYGIEANLLRKCPQIDFIITGEGENKLKSLLDALCAGQFEKINKIGGIFHQKENKILFENNLSQKSFKDFGFNEANHKSLIEYQIKDEYNSFNVQFSRGCPYACTFCGMTQYWGKRYRCRPLTSFINEFIQLHRKYHINKIGIVDNIFTYDANRIAEFCDTIIQLDLKVFWGCYSRINCISEELLKKMALAGCKKIFFGIESGSNAVLDQMHKGITQQEIIKTVKMSLDYIDIVTTSFVWGFPFETTEDIRQTITLLVYLSSLGASPKLSLLTPYPYTDITKLNYDKLCFDKELSTEFLYYKMQNALDDHISKTILANKDICSAFYHISHPSLFEKYTYLESMHLGNKDFFDAWEKAKPDQNEIEI